MPQTKLGDAIAGWSERSKADLKADLDNLPNVPLDVLRPLFDQIAKTSPACNVLELATLEAQRRGLPDAQVLADASSAFSFILANIDRESPETITDELSALGVLSGGPARILKSLLASATPFREAAKVASSYIRLGSPLFASISGTVDLRLRFHKTDMEFQGRKPPTELVAAQPIIVANLYLNNPDDEETTISFIMDESDLSYMKRFVANMEKELELSKNVTIVKPSEQKRNG